MATNRSRRLRKKPVSTSCQELGFELNLNFREGLSDAELDAFVEAFLRDAIEGNGLGYVGDEDYGFVSPGPSWFGQRRAARRRRGLGSRAAAN